MYRINTNLEHFSYDIMVDMKGVSMVLVSIFVVLSTASSKI